MPGGRLFLRYFSPLTLRFPILPQKIGNTAELTGIVRHKDQAISQGDGGDLQIVRANGRPFALKVCTDFAVHKCSGIVERKRDKLIEELLMAGLIQ